MVCAQDLPDEAFFDLGRTITLTDRLDLLFFTISSNPSARLGQRNTH